MALCLVFERHLKDDWSTGTLRCAIQAALMDFISCVTVHLGVSQEKIKCAAFESGASNVTKWTKFK